MTYFLPRPRTKRLNICADKFQFAKPTYACINLGDAYAPDNIAARSICIDGDIGEILTRL